MFRDRADFDRMVFGDVVKYFEFAARQGSLFLAHDQLLALTTGVVASYWTTTGVVNRTFGDGYTARVNLVKGCRYAMTLLRLAAPCGETHRMLSRKAAIAGSGTNISTLTGEPIRRGANTDSSVAENRSVAVASPAIGKELSLGAAAGRALAASHQGQLRAVATTAAPCVVKSMTDLRCLRTPQSDRATQECEGRFRIN